MEKSAVLNPIPIASDRTATAAKPGLRSSHFSAYRVSDSMPEDTSERSARFQERQGGGRYANRPYAYIPRILVTVATRLIATM